MSKEQLLDQQHRLLAIREHLGVRARVESPDFAEEVARACVNVVRPILDRNAGEQGEKILAAIALELGVRFEEVENAGDIKRVEQKYLVEQKELGFGVMGKELAKDDVDALLFQRMHAHAHAADRWVAVLNLQKSRARAYWSRPHELIHRIAEPPQQRLPFFRHKSDYENRLERLIDLGAAELAFPKIAFAPVVECFRNQPLTWKIVQSIGAAFAPTASLLSVAKATLRHWRAPTLLLIAQMRAKKGDPHCAPALRIAMEGFSSTGERCGVFFFPNMRVPPLSVVMGAFATQSEETGREILSAWRTSTGKRLPDRPALISAKGLQSRAYVLVSPE